MGATVQMKLLHPYWLVVFVLLIIFAYFSSGPIIANAWRKVISPGVLRFLSPERQSVATVSPILISAALAALALSTPAIRTADENSFQHATGWVAVADVSRSMTLDDVAPSRITAMRDALDALSRSSGARPMALVIYAGDAFLVVPPVFDKTLLNEHIALLDYGIIAHDGSNLARALSLTTAVINDSEFMRARVFVFSDSDGINNNSIAAARHLSANGHQVDMVIFGTPTEDIKTAINVDAGHAFANAGAGKLLVANRLGEIDLDKLELDSVVEATHNADVRALYWQNQSHWLLLFMLPLALLWFRQDA